MAITRSTRRKMGSPLLRVLPPELMLRIAELEEPGDIARLKRTCHGLNNFLEQSLFRQSMWLTFTHWEDSVLEHAALYNKPDLARRVSQNLPSPHGRKEEEILASTRAESAATAATCRNNTGVVEPIIGRFGRRIMEASDLNWKVAEFGERHCWWYPSSRVMNDYGWSLVHWAAAWGATEVIDVLVAAGADVERLDATGLRPLDVAVWVGRPAGAHGLLRNGADRAMVHRRYRSKLRRMLVGEEVEQDQGARANPSSALNERTF